MLKKYLSRFPHAIRGITFATISDTSFRHQIYVGVALTLGAIILFKPLASWELLFITLSWTLILITEIQNSALEAALDRIHPGIHEGIKRSKDMAAGAVLIAGVFLLITLVIISYSRLN